MKNVMNHTPTIEQLFVDKTELERAGYSISFVKIILKKNGNFDLALRKRVHRIIALVSSYNPSKINSKYFSSLNPYAFLFIIFILLFIPSTLALDIW